MSEYNGFQSLGEFIDELKARRLIATIDAPVDKDSELACIARLCADSLAGNQPLAVLFNNVRGFKMPVVTGLYSTIENYALALRCNPGNVMDRWREAVKSPIEPVVADDGAIEHTTLSGPEINLYDLPIPTWTPGKDPAPFFSSACVITRDPLTGIQNMGVYRIQLQGRSSVSVGFGSHNQHGAVHMQRYHNEGKDCPVAIVVGAEPAVQFAAAAKTAYGVDELTVAGGLLQQPIKTVTGASVPLRYPESAEIVLEGYIKPADIVTEGPFGEALGIMSETGTAPLLEISALRMRNTPVMHGYIQQVPPSEGHMVWQMGILGPLFHYLHDRMHMTMVRSMAIKPGSAGLTFLVVCVNPCSAEERQNLLKILSRIEFGQKFICLVDDDIDIYDSNSIQFALSSRVNPAQDIKLIGDTKVYQPDYSVYADMKYSEDGYFRSSMALIDATVKADAPPVALAHQSLFDGVRSRWEELRLPPLKAPNDRIARLLDSHHPLSRAQP